MSKSFYIDDRAFQRELKIFQRRSTESFRIAILKATLEMKKAAKLKIRQMTRGSRVKSGYLINNIIHRVTSKGITGEVISKAPYSIFIEEGTRPHIVRRRTKKVLAGPLRGRPPGWNVSEKSKSMGYATYGKEIRHPGTQPRPFMYPAWRYGMKVFERELRKVFR